MWDRVTGNEIANMTLREKLGQRIAIGFSGTELTEELREFLEKFKIGNVILFAHNIESLGQVKELCRNIQEVIVRNTGYPAFIMIDQEGGPIVRLTKEAVNVPGAMALAATGNPENAYLAGQMTGRQLASLGINFNLAPVLDVNCNPDNPVIGVRSYGEQPEQVAEYGIAMMNGLISEGVVACAKHFPGHGDTREDSHLSLPIVDKTLAELLKTELLPFQKAVNAGVPAVMTSHVVYPALDEEHYPATISKAIVTGLLREKFGYQGLVVSDSMEMAAIQKYYGTQEGVLAAFRAGVDIALITHTLEKAEAAILLTENAVKEESMSIQSVDESVKRILVVKERYANPKKGHLVEREDYEMAMMLMRKSFVAVNLPFGRLPDLGDNPFFAGCYAYQASLVSNKGDRKNCFPVWLAERFGGSAFVFTPDPPKEEIAQILELAAGHSSIVVGTYNGHLRQGQKMLLEELVKMKIPMIVFALRNPYDLLALPETVTAIAAWEYTERSLEEIGRLLKGEWIPEGILPVSIS